MSTLFTIGQSNKLMDALENAGFTPDDVTKLQQCRHLGMLKSVLSGQAQIITVKHVIDCDSVPYTPSCWGLEEHVNGGQLEWNPDKVELYRDERQRKVKGLAGKDLRKSLSSKQVMNANVLDYLLANPELIPNEWKKFTVYFWGTIYLGGEGPLFSIRGLCWDNGKWISVSGWLGANFLGYDMAAISK